MRLTFSVWTGRRGPRSVTVEADDAMHGAVEAYRVAVPNGVPTPLVRPLPATSWGDGRYSVEGVEMFLKGGE